MRLPDRAEAIRRALHTTPFAAGFAAAARKALALWEPPATVAGAPPPLAISAVDVKNELAAISGKADRAGEEQDIYEAWVEGGAKLRHVDTWMNEEAEVRVYHDSTSHCALLIIRVHAQPPGSPYAHAVLVPDDTAKQVAAPGTLKALAQSLYGAPWPYG